MLSPPTQLWTEVQRPQEDYNLRPSNKLAKVVSHHFNQYNNEYTSDKHICIGVHCESILFQLHLAVRTFNACSSAFQSTLALKRIRETDLYSDDPTHSLKMYTDKHTLYILHTDCPVHRTHFQHLTQHNQHIILVCRIPDVLTEKKWACAFAIFPNLQRSETQTEFTAVRHIMNEIQTELGTVPTQNIQNSATLTFSPWVQSFLHKYSTLVNGIQLFIINVCTEKNIHIEKPRTFHVPYHLQLHYRNVSTLDHERIQYVAQACSASWTVQVQSESERDTVSLRLRLHLHPIENDAPARRMLMLNELPAVFNEHWVPDESFIQKWYPTILHSIDVLGEILTGELV